MKLRLLAAVIAAVSSATDHTEGEYHGVNHPHRRLFSTTSPSLLWSRTPSLLSKTTSSLPVTRASSRTSRSLQNATATLPTIGRTPTLSECLGGCRINCKNDSDRNTTTMQVTLCTKRCKRRCRLKRDTNSIFRVLRKVSGGNGRYPKLTPQGKAAQWIVKVDRLQLTAESPNLAQRYILAVLFFSTASESDINSWSFCRPPVPFLQPHNLTKCEFLSLERGKMVNSITWLSHRHECQWMGVFCSSQDMKVRSLQINANNMTGTLPAELSKLSALRSLAFLANKVGGTIPSQLGSMRRLESLALSENFLTGTIPPEIYNLTSVSNFHVGSNLLSGTLSPLVKNWALSPFFKEFHTYFNLMTGTIPTELGSLVTLWDLRINDNSHHGRIPTELGQLNRLRDFSVQRNELAGTLPWQLGNLTRVIEFYANGNFLEGEIPNSLWNLKVCRALFLYDNLLEGTLPPQVGQMKSLDTLVLRRNMLSGAIPSEFGQLTNLRILWLHLNAFTGSVPSQICQLRQDGFLDILSTDCLGEDDSRNNPPVECSCCTQCCNPNSELCLRTLDP